jgi:hypothetical protein
VRPSCPIEACAQGPLIGRLAGFSFQCCRWLVFAAVAVLSDFIPMLPFRGPRQIAQRVAPGGPKVPLEESSSTAANTTRSTEAISGVRG